MQSLLLKSGTKTFNISILPYITSIALRRAQFATQNTLVGSLVPERNSNLRVMTTPEWPVPYYQR